MRDARLQTFATAFALELRLKYPRLSLSRWRRCSSRSCRIRGRARCSRRRGTDNRARSLLRRCRRCHRRRSARYRCRRGPRRATCPPGTSTRRTSVTRHARLPIRQPYHKAFSARLSRGPLEGARRRCVTPPSPVTGGRVTPPSPVTRARCTSSTCRGPCPRGTSRHCGRSWRAWPRGCRRPRRPPGSRRR